MRKMKLLSLNYFDNSLSIADANQFAALQYSDDGAIDFERNRMKEVLKNIIELELTERQRDCVKLIYFGGYTRVAAADEMGITLPTLSKHLKKAGARIEKTTVSWFKGSAVRFSGRCTI